MENQTQSHPKKQRSHQIDRLKLSVFSALLFNAAMVVGGTPIWANEVETQQPSTEMNAGIVNPAAMDATTQTGEHTAQPKQTSAIAGQPLVEPQLPVVVPPTALPTVDPSTVAPVSMEVAPQNPSTLDPDLSSGLQATSQKASDLLGTPEPQTLSQSETQTPSEGQPTDPASKPVNNPLLPPPGWRFDFEPYLFLPFKVNGDIFFGRGRRILFPNRPTFPNSPGEIGSGSGFNLSVDARLSDITADLTNIFGISGRLQAWNGNFGIVADGLYVNSGFSTSSTGGYITLRDQFNIPTPGFKIDTQSTIASFALAASYKVVTVPFRTITDPSNPSNYYPAISFEVLAGARYLSVFQGVEFNRGFNFEVSGSEINPMLGGTVKLMLSDKFALYFRGDTSNLGGGNLKQYYNLYTGIDWKFSGSFALRLAYRINEIEFVKQGKLDGDNGLRLRSEGVQLGISWQF